MQYRLFWGIVAVVSSIGATLLSPLYALILIALFLIAITMSVTPLSGFALLLILAPLRTLVATESSLSLPVDIGQALFIVALSGYVMYAVIYRRDIFIRHWTPLYLPLGLFIASTGITVFVVQQPAFWFSEWLKWVVMLLAVAFVLTSGYSWRIWIYFLLIAAVGNAIVGLYIFFGGSGADHLLISNRFFRAFGTFGQPNPFGGFMGMTLPIASMLLLGYVVQMYHEWHAARSVSLGTIIKTSGILVICLLLGAALVASWSRGAWLGFMIACGVMAFALPKQWWQRIVLTVSGGLLLGGMWFSGILPDSIVQRITSSTQELFTISDVRGVDITSENYAIVERLAHWQAALNMARENPWLGVGFGNYEVAYSQHQLMNWDEPLGHAHNYYLNIIGEAGIMGILSYLIVWIALGWITWRVIQHPDYLTRFVAIGLLGSWSYISVHSLLDNLYVNNVFIHLGVMMGVLAIMYNQMSESTRWG